MSQTMGEEPTAEGPVGNGDSEPSMEWLSVGIGVGLSLGVAIGLLMGNIGLGIGMGLPVGVALGLAMKRRRQAGRDDDDSAS